MPAPLVAFTSRVIPLPAENVDTDQIIPARFLKTTEKSGLADALFSNWRYLPDGTPRPDFVLNRPEMAGRAVLLAGANFGSGSSREHAPWALLSWGIRAVISTGFADIFRANALKNGLLPIVVSPERHAALFELLAADPDVELTIDLAAQEVRVRRTAASVGGGSAAAGGGSAAAGGKAPGADVFTFEIDPFARQMLLEGTDEIGYVLARLPAIEAWEAANPARVNTLA
jgi:3-isopropylmalate/(R)-2-methylmalate dehydratase small subunit